MSSISLIQFEDEEGKQLSEVLQVPNGIELEQLKSLIETHQDLFVDGNMITSTLENALQTSQLDNVEEIKKIRLCKDMPSSKPAFYCSSVYSGHEGPVLVTKFAKDILITAGGDKTVRFWDLLTKTQFKVVEKHTHWILALDANDEYIVSGGMDGLINMYDYKGNHIRTLNKHKKGISMLRITEDKIVSCSRDCTCIVWGLDGSVLATWTNYKPVKSLCVTKDLVITGCTDGTVKVYKDMKYHCSLTGHTSQVNCIIANSRFIISGDDNGQIILWKDFHVFRRLQHKREVISLAFNPNGISFASGSFDKTVKLWNIETAECISTYFHVNLVYKVQVTNDMIISCSKDKTVKMYKISCKKVVSDLICEDEVYDFDFRDEKMREKSSSAGGHLVCGTKSNKVYFFN